MMIEVQRLSEEENRYTSEEGKKASKKAKREARVNKNLHSPISRSEPRRRSNQLSILYPYRKEQTMIQ